jgi:hypothetical protein
MNALAQSHPLQEAFSFLSLLSARAESQLLFRQLADWGRAEVTACGELFVEIATDADYLDDRLHAAAEDGRFDGEELAELSGLAREIKTEAVTGKIIR